VEPDSPQWRFAVGTAHRLCRTGAALAEQARVVAERERATAADQRDRAQIAGEIGARLYAYDGDPERRADDLLHWLGRRMPGDEVRQSEALAAFAGSVSAEDRGNSDELLIKIVEVLGADYRARAVDALIAGNDPNRYLYAALLQRGGDAVDAASPTITSLLQSAIDARPDDPLVLQTAAIHCPRGRCPFPDAAERLAGVDPDNMYAWLLTAIYAEDDERWRDRLHEAARRERFDDYMGASFNAYARAIDAAAVPMPALLSRPALMLAPSDRPEATIALSEAHRTARLASYQRLTERCGVSVGSTPATDPQVLEDCRTIGTVMLRSKSGLISQMIGVALLRVLARGTPLAEEALQARRRYAYYGSALARLSASQRMSYPAERYLHDLLTEGEMVAFQRRVAHSGLPDQVPDDWAPSDPTSLLSASERHDNTVALERETRALVEQHDYDATLAMMAPLEASVRSRWPHHWLLARVLTTKGRALLGLRRFAEAAATLDEAWDVVEAFPPGTREASECARALADLHADWQEADADGGHGALALHWAAVAARQKNVRAY
jgi:hypothetical protein